MRFKENINVKGILRIYEDGKLILTKKNTLVNGLNMIGNQMSSFSGINQMISHSGYLEIEPTWTASYGFVPTAIYVENATNHWWMPIMSYSTSGGTVLYQAKMYASEFTTQNILTVKLGASRYWNHLDWNCDPSSADYGKIRTTTIPDYMYNTDFIGQPSLAYGIFHMGGNPRAYILKQEMGFISGLAGTDSYRIYDDGTYWKVEQGSAVLHESGNDYGQLICNGIETRTDDDTTLDTFSLADLSTEPVYHFDTKTLLFAWQLIFSV